MSRERLQEHFSELFEGTIDPGLAQQIKTRFDSDYDLQADYKGFAETMSLLETMKDETIETPPNLSSMIADRLEANAKKPAMTLALMWRNLGFGALACVAIGGAFLTMKNRNTGGPIGADLTGGPLHEAPRKVLDTFEVKIRSGKPRLLYTSSGPKTVTILSQEDQSVLKKYSLDGNPMDCPLENPGEAPAVLEINATGESARHLIVLPGSSIDYEAVGHGDLVAFAKVLATKFRTVVHIQVPKDLVGDLKWDVSQSDVKDAAKAVVSTSEYTVTGDSQVIVIQKQSH